MKTNALFAVQTKKFRPALGLLLCFALTLPLFCGCSSKTITAQEVEALLKSVDAASARKDPQVLLDYLANDATIMMRLNGPLGPQDIRYTAKEYREQVKDKLAAMQDYKYQRLQTKIDIAPDKKSASATLQVLEFITLKQGTFRIDTNQRSDYTKSWGKLLIKSVQCNSTMARAVSSPKPAQ